jgi:DNA-binding transcriptional regulator YiaG
MVKMESLIKLEIVRLAKREIRKISVPLKRDVLSLKKVVSQIRGSVQALESFASAQKKELVKRETRLEGSPEEVKISRFSPRLFRSLRKHLGITQKELSILCGVTVGAVQSWESGKFRPKDEKRRILVALRKLGRGNVKKLLQERRAG